MANIRWTRLGLAGFERGVRTREDAVAVRPEGSPSTAVSASRGSLAVTSGGWGSAPPGGFPSRRSNSASVMLGRVRPVRLSGPGIPPRRVGLLIVYLPCPSRRRPSRVPALNNPSRTNPPEYGPFIGTGLPCDGPVRRPTSMPLGSFAQIGTSLVEVDILGLGQLDVGDGRLGAAGEVGRGRGPVSRRSLAQAVVVDQRNPPRISFPEFHRR